MDETERGAACSGYPTSTGRLPPIREVERPTFSECREGRCREVSPSAGFFQISDTPVRPPEAPPPPHPSRSRPVAIRQRPTLRSAAGRARKVGRGHHALVSHHRPPKPTAPSGRNPSLRAHSRRTCCTYVAPIPGSTSRTLLIPDHYRPARPVRRELPTACAFARLGMAAGVRDDGESVTP